jgi:hypothetical protein
LASHVEEHAAGDDRHASEYQSTYLDKRPTGEKSAMVVHGYGERRVVYSPIKVDSCGKGSQAREGRERQ